MNNFFNKKILLQSIPFLFLFVIVFPKLLGHGMFVDGVLYATIARNISEGIGSVWRPYYTATLYPSFFEHPPFVLYIQSILFQIFGDTRWVERTYTLVMGIFQIILIGSLWKVVTNDKSLKWVAPFLFVVTPVVFWVIANNEFENTLIVFMLLSALFSVLGCKTSRVEFSILYGTMAGLFVVLGFLSKGVFAFYPIVFPFFCYFFLLNANKLKSIYCQFSLLVSVLLFSLPIYLNTQSRDFLEVYFKNQVYKSLTGQREIDLPHFQIFRALAENIILPIGVCAVLFLIRRNSKYLNFNKNTGLFFFMALSASLPLAVSSKNHGWYLMISMPFYTLALASLCSHYFGQFQEWCLNSLWGKRFLNLSVTVLVITCIILSVRNYNRVLKNDQYHDDFTIQGNMPLTNVVVSFCPLWFRDKAETWMMIANLARDYKLSLSVNENYRYRVYLVNHPMACKIPSTCKLEFPKSPKVFAMYDCKDDPQTALIQSKNEMLLDKEAQKF